MKRPLNSGLAKLSMTSLLIPVSGSCSSVDSGRLMFPARSSTGASGPSSTFALPHRHDHIVFLALPLFSNPGFRWSLV